MITSIKGIAYKFLRGNKFILFSSVIAIFISTTLIIGIFNFIDKSSKNFEEETKSKYGIQDISVGYETFSNKSLTTEIENKIRDIEGVKDVKKVLISNFDDGIVIGSNNGYMTKSRYKYSKDLEDKEVVITSSISEQNNLRVGDSISIDGNLFKIKEIIDTKAKIKIINIEELRLLSGKIDGGTYCLVKTNGENKKIGTELKNIDDEFRIEVVEEYEELKNSQMSLKIFTSFLAFLILLIGSLFINSNMQNILYKYKEQFSLLRSIGASGKDIFQLLFFQSTIINFIGISISIIFSYIFNILNFYSLIIALIIFTLLELFTILSPIKGLKIMPLNIYRENELSSFELSKSRKNIGIVLGLGSVVIIILSLISKDSNNSFIYIFIASIALLIAFVILLPFVLKVIMNKLLSRIGKIISSSRRNYLCILIITITTIISVFGSSFLFIINKNSIAYLKSLYPKDITVAVYPLNHGEGEEVFERIKSIDNAKCTPVYVDYVAMVKENKILDFSISFDSAVNRGEVILLKEIADKYRINKGDILSVRKSSLRYGEAFIINKNSPTYPYDEEVAKVTVIDIVDKLDRQSFYYNGIMNIEILEQLYEYKDPITVYIETDDIQSVKLALKELQKEYPEIYFGTYEEELQKDKDEMDKRWGIFKVALLAIIISTFLGVYNMIIDYLYSKKDEMKTLRALGLTKGRLASNIAHILIVYFTIGITCGSILGVLISTLLFFTG